MDKLDLLVAINLADFYKSGLFNPSGLREEIRKATGLANQFLIQDKDLRDTFQAELLELDLSTLKVNIAASEVTVNIGIESSAIQMPVDVQGSYIQMPVDIQGQYVTLDINIAASAVSLTVVATNLSVQIDAQNVGVYLQPDWATVKDLDIAWGIEGTPAVGGFLQITVVCPAGKTWYITSFCVAAVAQVAADRNNNQFALGWLYNNTTGTTYAQITGNGGFFHNFNQPVVVLEGQTLIIRGENYANHQQRMRVFAKGYQL